MQCYGSKRWRWSIQWKNWSHRDQLRAKNSRNLIRWTQRLLLLWTRSPEFPIQEEGQSRGTECQEGGPVSTRKTDRLCDLWPLSCYWCSWYGFLIMLRQCSRIWYKMGRSSAIHVKNSTRWCSGKFVQIEDSWVWSTQNRIGIVRHGNYQKISTPNFQRLKTMVKRSTDQKLGLRNFDARHVKIENGSVVKSHRGLSGVERGKGIFDQWKEKGQCSKGDQCSFRQESNDRAKPTPKAEPLSEPQNSKTRGRSVSWKRNARGRSQSEKFNRPLCKYFLKGTCTKSFCEYWHPPECQFYKTKSGCKFGAECSFLHWKVEEQPNKKPKKNEGQIAGAIVKSVPQLICVSQDTEPPDPATFSRKGTRVLDSQGLHCVKQTSEKTKVRRSGKFKSNFLISEVPTLWNLRTDLQERLKRQERCARGDAWELARKNFNFQKEDRGTFYSPSEEW